MSENDVLKALVGNLYDETFPQRYNRHTVQSLRNEALDPHPRFKDLLRQHIKTTIQGGKVELRSRYPEVSSPKAERLVSATLLCTGGCGPTQDQNIVHTLRGKNVPPQQVDGCAQWLSDLGLYEFQPQDLDPADQQVLRRAIKQYGLK